MIELVLSRLALASVDVMATSGPLAVDVARPSQLCSRSLVYGKLGITIWEV